MHDENSVKISRIASALGTDIFALLFHEFLLFHVFQFTRVSFAWFRSSKAYVCQCVSFFNGCLLSDRFAGYIWPIWNVFFSHLIKLWLMHVMPTGSNTSFGINSNCSTDIQMDFIQKTKWSSKFNWERCLCTETVFRTIDQVQYSSSPTRDASVFEARTPEWKWNFPVGLLQVCRCVNEKVERVSGI